MSKEQLRITDYLEHILYAIQRIRNYTHGMVETSFLENEQVQDAVLRNIEIIGEADVLTHSGMSRRSVINRLYYAMFYAVLALLQEKEMGTSKHSGAIALFDREYVKTGLFPKEMPKALQCF